MSSHCRWIICDDPCSVLSFRDRDIVFTRGYRRAARAAFGCVASAVRASSFMWAYVAPGGLCLQAFGVTNKATPKHEAQRKELHRKGLHRQSAGLPLAASMRHSVKQSSVKVADRLQLVCYRFAIPMRCITYSLLCVAFLTWRGRRPRDKLGWTDSTSCIDPKHTPKRGGSI